MPVAIDLDPYRFPCDGPFLGVPHGANVLTNLPFLAIGAWGLAGVLRRGLAPGSDANRLGLWASVALLSLGSGAYHLAPSPATLTADRAAISGILAFVVAEALAAPGGAVRARTTALLLAATEGTVALWLLGATSWPYGALQAAGAVLVLVLVVRGFRAGRLPRVAVRSVLAFVAFYALAKGAEVLDEPICAWTGTLGGHPLKHLLAGAGLAALLPWLGRSARPV